jgi:HD-like signal output (HDOD) protein
VDMETAFSALPGRQEAIHRVAGVADLPPLAGALERLLEVIYSEVASVRELESIILYDQALAAKLLRLANSSFYGSRGQVYTVAQAIMLIGFEQVKSICLCVLLMQLYSGAPALSAAQRERLWKHAFAAAHMAREVARVRPWVSKEVAYVLGLFHDLGRLTMAVHFKDYFHLITDLAKTRKIPPRLVESECGLTHTEIGGWMSVRWALPEVFTHVMEYHHKPHQSPDHKPEVTLIFLADVLANSEQYAEYLDDPFTLACARQLRLTEEDWEQCIERSSAIWPQVDAFWTLLK